MSERILHTKQQRRIIYLINGMLMELQLQTVLEKQQNRQTTLENNSQVIQIKMKIETVEIPDDATNVTITVTAGAGGAGGFDSNGTGGSGGQGKSGKFSLADGPYTHTLHWWKREKGRMRTLVLVVMVVVQYIQLVE